MCLTAKLLLVCIDDTCLLVAATDLVVGFLVRGRAYADADVTYDSCLPLPLPLPGPA